MGLAVRGREKSRPTTARQKLFSRAILVGSTNLCQTFRRVAVIPEELCPLHGSALLVSTPVLIKTQVGLGRVFCWLSRSFSGIYFRFVSAWAAVLPLPGWSRGNFSPNKQSVSISNTVTGETDQLLPRKTRKSGILKTLWRLWTSPW